MARIITFNTIGNIDKSLAGDNALGQLRDFPGIGLSNGITEGTGAIAYNDNGSSIGHIFSFNSAINAFGVDITTSEASSISFGGAFGMGANTLQFFGVIDFDNTFTNSTIDVSGGA